MRRVALALAGLAAFGIAAGCGGDEDGDSETGAHAAYVASSTAICERHERRVEAELERITDGGELTPRKAQLFLRDAVVPALRAGLRERSRLPAPAGDEAEVAAIIAAGREAIRGFERLAADRGRVAALFAGAHPDPARRYDALSRRYGIAECGGGS